MTGPRGRGSDLCRTCHKLGDAAAREGLERLNVVGRDDPWTGPSVGPRFPSSRWASGAEG